MKHYPSIYSQRDSRWSLLQLGTVNESTIGNHGCLLTCFAMKAEYYGYAITPDKLNLLFTTKHMYTHGNLLTDNALSKVIQNVQYLHSDHYESIPADLQKLAEYIKDPLITVTLCIEMPDNTAHFAEVADCDEEKVTIINPWNGQVEDFQLLYGQPAQTILRFIVYKGNAGKNSNNQV